MRTLCSAILFFYFDFVFCSYISKGYVVPEPSIEVYSPQGFQVKIPHEDGVHLFAFHGNINKPMEHLEAGQFSKDILKRKGDEWIFEDRGTKLKKGDVIYYWLFVIKNNLGYRFDDGMFTIKDIIQSSQSIDSQIYVEDKPETQLDNDLEEEPPRLLPMCELKKNLTDTVADLKKEIEVMKEITGVLKGLIPKDDDVSRILKFEGTLPPDDDASYVAHIIIREKLGLSVPVTDASRDANGDITFKVASLDDKIYLIRKSKEKLAQSKIRLVY